MFGCRLAVVSHKGALLKIRIFYCLGRLRYQIGPMFPLNVVLRLTELDVGELLAFGPGVTFFVIGGHRLAGSGPFVFLRAWLSVVLFLVNIKERVEPILLWLWTRHMAFPGGEFGT